MFARASERKYVSLLEELSIPKYDKAFNQNVGMYLYFQTFAKAAVKSFKMFRDDKIHSYQLE